MENIIQVSEMGFRSLTPGFLGQRNYGLSILAGKIGMYIDRAWDSDIVLKDQVYPPGEVVPRPNEPEILPDPDIPEEEEYLPDEEEIPVPEEEPRREIDEPYQPDRERDFPPNTEPAWPQEEPKK
ncbi:hypothetical protein LZF95_08285 [Algoriphagus sp. AGSA1]|uniref:hypothetical protein n=1 Tax=Algoriphagus sp. AGSA1 TaxID=2907213 RepID=UPI001F2EB171|nr:hypothetical protein [Algoriphagus sp. AGSA1]MCE7054667.1 hypothetical protein [Algoriphagus sp. AGSA1]